MIQFSSHGSFSKTLSFIGYLKSDKMFSDLNAYGRQGVDALRSATPVDSGLTAESWEYRIVKKKGKWQVQWYNTNEQDGVNIAVILQYGHATRDGGYIEGIDYINPALEPIFANLANNVWKKVTDV